MEFWTQQRKCFLHKQIALSCTDSQLKLLFNTKNYVSIYNAEKYSQNDKSGLFITHLTTSYI